METRANYVLIGAFVFLAVAALALFSVWISKAQFNREYDIYDVVFESPPNGLSEGGEVRFNGIKVGEVTQLGLDKDDPSRVIARIRVNSDTPVRVDSKAQLNMQGITGVTFILISAGDTDKPLMEQGNVQAPARIPTERTQLEELFEGGQDVLASSTDVLARINLALSDDNIVHFSNILKNIDDITTQAAEGGELVAEMRTAIRSLSVAGEGVNAAAVTMNDAAIDFDKRFQQVVTDAGAFLSSADKAIGSAENLFNDAGGAVGDLTEAIGPGAEEVLNELSNAAREMRILINRLDTVVQDVERDPRDFVLGDNKPFE